MEKIGLFYGSTTGETEDIVEKVKENFTENLETINIQDSSVEEIENYKNLIFATSTWGDGELQSDWEKFEDCLENIDFSNKNIALIGLGDQESYPDTFSNAIGVLYEKIGNTNILGKTSTKGYNFEESKALVEDKFIGLVLDQVNQEELTKSRIEAWTKQVKEEFGNYN